jgi:hypothetical protein
MAKEPRITPQPKPAFLAVAGSKLRFYANDGQAREFETGTRVAVTLESFGYDMSTSHEGATYNRFGVCDDFCSPFPAATATAEEVGGIGLGTEFGDKVASLAFDLVRIPYPWVRGWADVEPHIVDNYYADAEGIIRDHPHLLTLPERERLAPLYPELAI